MKADYEDRKIHIELLRIIAAYFVIFNHTGDSGFFLFPLYPDTSIQYWCYLFASVFCKFSVPLFFMISGAMLLPKDESIKDVYRKRVLRIIITLILFSFLNYVYNNQEDFSVLSIDGFAKPLYGSDHNYTYWYLYAFIPYLMALPLLRPFAKNLDNKHFLYLICCVLFFNAILPITEYILWQGSLSLNGNFRMEWLTSNAVLYPLVGHYIENRLSVDKCRRFLLPLWIVNIITIMITCCMTFYKARITGVCNEASSQTFYNCFVLLNCLSIYVTARCYCANHSFSTLFKSTIASLGSASFGVYLFHFMVMNTLVDKGMLTYFRESLGINYLVSALLLCLFTFLIGYLLTVICKQIPILKKLL